MPRQSAQDPGNLPPETTSFVGRRRDLLELKRKLGSVRLVSLVGPGGVGKTRLAVRAAREMRRNFRHGAWIVELADVHEPELVPGSVLDSLGLRDLTALDPRSLLVGYLRDKEVLLALDNCEHLLDACASIADSILRSAPAVKILVTSREPLAITGEYVQPLTPLDLPPSGGAEGVGQLRDNEAVALFVERAAAAAGGFELSSANQLDVIEICRRLDGLPLALELAAARMRSLSAKDLRERLSDRFGLLTGGSRAALPRHQTLRFAIDWSYDLLNERERSLLRRLGVFASSFSLAAAGAVAPTAEPSTVDVLNTLTSLVEKSLVAILPTSGSSRYRLHETMRDYALSKLAERGEEVAARRAVADYYVTSCVGTFEKARHRLDAWLDSIDPEMDNVRAVLSWLLEIGDYDAGAGLAGALGWYWITRAVNEGIHWLDEFLARPVDSVAAIVQASFVKGIAAMMQNDPQRALPALALGLELAREEQLHRLQVQILTTASLAEDMAGAHARAVAATEEAKGILSVHPDEVAEVAVAQSEGFNALVDGDIERATRVYANGADVARKVDDAYMLAYCVMDLGFIKVMTGQFAAAQLLFDEALSIVTRIDDRIGQSYVLDGLGFVAVGTGDPQRGARLLGAAERARLDVGATPNVLLAPLIERAAESGGSALGMAAYEREVDAGRGMDRETALAYALGTPGGEERVAIRHSSAKAATLGKRELEVAKLVAEGLSNKEIASRLFLSERTVESHVRNSLIKLGFSARTQIASWFAASGHAIS